MLKKGPVWSLGAMSGTSLDGVDAAMLRTDGTSICAIGETGYLAYTDVQRQILKNALGKEAGDDNVAEAANVVEDVHAEVLSGFANVDIIGFHGQTLVHKPDIGRTFQAGDGSILAKVLNCPVVWDFRSSDMELGGQGAPLAPFFHFACAKWIDAKEPVVFVNIGGVANMTYVDPSCAKPEDVGALLAFDTGPGNAQLNDIMQRRCGTAMDQNGELAAQGTVVAEILDRFVTNGYFSKIPPKSLDRNDFTFLIKEVEGLSDADAAATLTATIAASVMHGQQFCPRPATRLLVTGGGRKNPVLMRMLSAGMDAKVDAVEAVGLDGDMLEAQAFAYLAVRVERGLPTSCPSTTGVSAAVGGGKISLPD